MLLKATLPVPTTTENREAQKNIATLLPTMIKRGYWGGIDYRKPTNIKIALVESAPDFSQSIYDLEVTVPGNKPSDEEHCRAVMGIFGWIMDYPAIAKEYVTGTVGFERKVEVIAREALIHTRSENYAMKFGYEFDSANERGWVTISCDDAASAKEVLKKLDIVTMGILTTVIKENKIGIPLVQNVEESILCADGFFFLDPLSAFEELTLKQLGKPNGCGAEFSYQEHHGKTHIQVSYKAGREAVLKAFYMWSGRASLIPSEGTNTLNFPFDNDMFNIIYDGMRNQTALKVAIVEACAVRRVTILSGRTNPSIYNDNNSLNVVTESHTETFISKAAVETLKSLATKPYEPLEHIRVLTDEMYAPKITMEVPLVAQLASRQSGPVQQAQRS